MLWHWLSRSSTYECVGPLRTFHPLLTSRFTFQHLPAFVFCLFCVLVWFCCLGVFLFPVLRVSWNPEFSAQFRPRWPTRLDRSLGYAAKKKAITAITATTATTAITATIAITHYYFYQYHYQFFYYYRHHYQFDYHTSTTMAFKSKTQRHP